MSTYSIPVSGPDLRLAFLRALAHKASGFAGRFLTTVKLVLTRGTQLVRAASSTALAVIGSEAGYQLVRHAIRTVVTTTAKITMIIATAATTIAMIIMVMKGIQTASNPLYFVVINPLITKSLKTFWAAFWRFLARRCCAIKACFM